jgi:hypothetical protein
MSVVPSPPLERRDRVVAGAILLVVFLIHVLSPNATPFDSRWTVHTALSILSEGDTDLNEYESLLEADSFYAIECIFPDGRRVFPVQSTVECVGGRYYNWYPVAVPALAAPAAGVFELVLRAGQPLFGPLAERVPSAVVRSFLRGDLVAASAAVELIMASFIVALATALFYFVTREQIDRTGSAVLSLMLAFCTPAWSTASRALWQHGPAMLMLTLAMWISLRAGKNPALVRYLGIPLAFGFFLRPTLVVPAVVFTLFVLLYHRRQILRYLLWTAPVVVAFVIHSLVAYQTLVAPYFFVRREHADSLGLHRGILEALAGNMISPSRGLLIYVPLALLAIYGALIRPEQEQARRLRPFFVAMLLLHWCLISSFETWWGGHGYGPRFMTEIVVLLIYFLIPVWQRASADMRRRRYALPALASILALASFWIHLQGATNWACYEWSSTPVELNESLDRLWDWRDPAFLRGVRGGAPQT